MLGGEVSGDSFMKNLSPAAYCVCLFRLFLAIVQQLCYRIMQSINVGVAELAEPSCTYGLTVLRTVCFHRNRVA